MKRTVLLLMLTLMLLTMSKALAYDFCQKGVYYNITSTELSTVSVTYGDYSSGTYSGVLQIPETVTHEGTTYTVTGIASSACYYCTQLTAIHIPASVQTIGTYAFYMCQNLQDVYITDLTAWCNITMASYYESNPFNYAKNLYLNYELVTKLELTAENVNIYKNTLRGCASLTEVVITSGVTQLNGTFQGCYNLKKVTIPATVSSIDALCFSGCTKLNTVIIEDGSSSLRLADREYWSGRYDDTYHHNGAFCDCPITELYLGRSLSWSYNPFLENYDGDLYTMINSTLKTLELGKTITSVPSPLNGCGKLETVIVHAPIPPSASDFSADVYESAKLIIPWESNQAYRTALPWQQFKNIRHLKTDNQLSVADATVFAGQTLQMPIALDNATTINSVGGIITLPAGMTVEKDATGQYSISLNEERASQDDAFAVSCNQLADGTLKFLIVSTNGTDIKGTEGAIAYVSVVVGQELEGDYEMKLSSVQLSDANGKLIDCPDTYATITVEQYRLGDVNRDWQIAPNDITLAIKAYLGATIDNFCFLAADVNKNGEIDSADIIAIIRLYLNDGGTQASVRQAIARATTKAEDDVFLSEEMVEQDGEFSIDFSIDLKRDDYTCLGGTITLPPYFTFARNATGEAIVEKNDEVLGCHAVSSNLLNDHQLKFYIGSSDLQLLSAGLARLMSIKVQAAPNVSIGDYTYTLTNLQLSDFDANLYNATDATGILHIVDEDLINGIDRPEHTALSPSPGALYNMLGQRVSEAAKGLVIKEGKKVFRK